MTAAAVLVLWTGAAYFLPSLIETKILPDIAEKWGAEQFVSDVRRADTTGLDIRDIQIPEDPRPGLVVPSLQADYSIFGLLQKRIQCVRLVGMVIRLDISGTEATITGLDVRGLNASEKPDGESSAGFSVETIKIKSALLIVRYDESRFTIPADIEIRMKDGKYRFDAEIPGTDHSLNVEFDPESKQIRTSFNVKQLDLKFLPTFAGMIPGTAGSGAVDISGKIQGTSEPLGVTSATISWSGRSWKIGCKWFQLASSDSERKMTQLKWMKNESGHTVTVSNARIDAPIEMNIPELTVKAVSDKNGYDLSGRISVGMESSNGIVRNIQDSGQDISFQGVFSGTVAKDSTWRIQIESKTPGESENAGSGAVAGNVILSGNGPPDLETFQLDLKGNALTFRNNSSSYKINEIGIAARRTIPKSGKPSKIDFTLESSGLYAEPGSSLEFRAPSFSAKGSVYTNNSDGTTVDAVLDLSGADFQHSSSGLAFSGISGTVPFVWPFPDSGTGGNLEAERFRWKHVKFGAVTAKIAQRRCGLTYEARNEIQQAPGTTIKVSGALDLFGCGQTRIDYRVDRPAHAVPIDPGLFFPDSKGVQVDGTAHVEGGLGFRDGRWIWSLKSSLQDGEISIKREKISIDGIHGSLDIPDLFRMRSRPKQPLAFNKARFGNIELENGDFEFQIEQGGSVFIEKSSFVWCNGTIDGQAFRFDPGNKDYSLVFHCDGIELAELLKQFDIGKAGGDGTVNGKIPIRLKDGSIVFDNGFLYSTPGVGGVVRLERAESLAAGVPQNRRLNQIDLVLEALKEYTYNWVKLNLNTVDEDLMMRLQFDGKPSGPLPFSYESETGEFVRIEEGRGSVFQGISLDVNFRLPLNELLKYKDILKLTP